MKIRVLLCFKWALKFFRKHYYIKFNIMPKISTHLYNYVHFNVTSYFKITSWSILKKKNSNIVVIIGLRPCTLVRKLCIMKTLAILLLYLLFLYKFLIRLQYLPNWSHKVWRYFEYLKIHMIFKKKLWTQPKNLSSI